MRRVRCSSLLSPNRAARRCHRRTRVLTGHPGERLGAPPSLAADSVTNASFVLLQYMCRYSLTCTTLSFPGMCCNAASLKLLAPPIPLKPQRLPLAFSHDGSLVVFIVCGLIFSEAPRALTNTANPLHAHTN